MKRNEPLSILLVDDNPSVEEEVRSGLGKIGVPVSINYLCPKVREEDFGGCRLPVGREFDTVDLALIDLELFPPLESVFYTPEDLRGGTEILPYLRREAPWLPVIAYSKLFGQETARFVPIACGFGFDGHTTRGMFRQKWFDRDLWNSIVQRAGEQRRRAATGQQFDPALSDQVEIEVGPAVERRLDADIVGWRDAVKMAFFFARKVVLEDMKGGWSGALVMRAYARASHDDGGGEGQWMVKLSPSPHKLHKEVTAHLRMCRAGIKSARIVPLLWNGVLVHERIGLIAYQFARGSNEATSLVDGGGKLVELGKELNGVLREFYHDSEVERDIAGNLVSAAFVHRERLEKGLSEVNGDFADILSAHLHGENDRVLGASVQYRRTLIHGDLHLGNVMLGDNKVLVDFALSQPGPMAQDAARLIADVLVRAPGARVGRCPSWHDPKGGLVHIIANVDDVVKFGSGDRYVFQLFLLFYLCEALTYDSVEIDTKSWIRGVVGNWSRGDLEKAGE